MVKSEKNKLSLPEDEIESFGKLLFKLIDEKVIPSKYSAYTKNFLKQAASKGRNSEIEKSILNSAFNVPVNLSQTGEILFIGNNCKEQLGYEPDELTGRKFIDLITETDGEKASEIIAKLFRDKNIYSDSLSVKNKSGGSVLMKFTVEVIETGAGPIGQGRLQNLNERLKAEKYIRTSENVFKNVWKKSSEGMLLTDENGVVFMCNDSYARMFGLSKPKIEGQLFSSVYSNDTSRKILNNYLIRFKNDSFLSGYEGTYRLKNQSSIDLEVSHSFIKGIKNQKLLLSIYRDISGRKANESLFKKKDVLLQAIAEATKTLISVNDPEQGFNTALGILGTTTQVSRVYIVKHQSVDGTKDKYMTMIYEWCSKETQSQIIDPSSQNLSYSRFTSVKFYENLSHGKSINLLVNKLPEEKPQNFC